jgi:hypothetical protein
MTDTTPSDPPEERRSRDPAPQPSAARPPGADRPPINIGAVIGGAALGFFGNVFVFIAISSAFWGLTGGSSRTGELVVSVVAVLALPAIALTLMIFPRTRHAGAGLLLGVAIGSVIAAGLCAPLIVSG